MTRRIRRVTSVMVTLALLIAGLTAGIHRTSIRPAYDRDGLLIVLVIGSDIGVPYRPGDPLRGRADAIHIVAVDPGTARATLIDIPRDSMIAGTKVNAHLANGGPDALVGRLEDFTDLTIDFWILTTFQGFERITNDVGGVDVIVEQPMHDESSQSDFEPGPAHLQGKEALAFARDRHSLPDGDFGRTENQGDLLLAAHRRLADGSLSLADLGDVVGTLSRNTASNIPRADLLPLALLAADVDPEDVEHIPLTGSTGRVGGTSVVYVDPGNAFTHIANGHVGP